MPKETIRDQADQYHITVGWQRDGDVQVGVETADGQPIVEKLADGVGGSTLAAKFTSLWGSLDRQGVNDLIRHLRRARDFAYGRDE